MKSLMFVLVLSLSLPALADSKKSSKPYCSHGNSFITQDSKSKVWTFYVCDESHSPRQVNRTELNRMYNATKGDPAAMKNWSKVIEVDESKVASTLRDLPDKHLLSVDGKDPAVLKTLGGWYSEHVAKVGVQNTQTLPAAKLNDFFGAVQAGKIRDCLVGKGNLVMGETSATSGCYCGSTKYDNVAEFVCNNKQLVLKKPGGSPEPSHATK